MNSVSLFFNSKIEIYKESAPAAYQEGEEDCHTDCSLASLCMRIGDFGLTPVRYLFHGSTVRSDERLDGQREVEHVDSFHIKGEKNRSKVQLYLGPLRSGKRSWLRAVVSVICLVPGVICSLVKLLSYLSPEMNSERARVYTHLNPSK